MGLRDASPVPLGGRINVHVHYLTEGYREAMRAGGHAEPDGFPTLPDWSVEEALQGMERVGADFAVLSVSSPGVHFGDDAAARELARRVNEEGAAHVRAHPDRLGLFASLPLPDVEGSLVELGYALDELGADGLILQSNSNGLYLGDHRLDPLFEELDRRGSVALIHPASPPGWENIELAYPRPLLEFIFESTRAVANLVLTGTRHRFPNVELIAPHAGAALPVVADRIGGLLDMVPQMSELSAAEAIETLGTFWYDVAGFSTPRQLAAIQTLVGVDRLLAGSDQPFTPDWKAAELASNLDATPLLDEGEREAVYRGNALRLLPGVAARMGA
ncbi:MAG: amidohydrolase [Actinobacteria bacterium]|nr:amidohydrolase [Actinomycetota bacterium]